MARTTREQWLRAGLELLAGAGPGALTLERLTERMGRTKGSFYHHFQGFPAFKTALLDHIGALGYTAVVQVAEQSSTPRARFSRLVDEVAASPLHMENVLRTWSTQDPDVARLVGQLDRERLEYLERLLEELVGDQDRGRLLARLTYAAYLGALQLSPFSTPEELRRMFAEIERLVSGPQETP